MSQLVLFLTLGIATILAFLGLCMVGAKCIAKIYSPTLAFLGTLLLTITTVITPLLLKETTKTVPSYQLTDLSSISGTLTRGLYQATAYTSRHQEPIRYDVAPTQYPREYRSCPRRR